MDYFLGVDIGYSNLKTAFGPEGGQPTTRISPAGACPADALGTSFMGRSEQGVRVLVDEQPFAACIEPSRATGWTRALHEDYTSSQNFKALFLAALLQAEVESIDMLVTGLPVSQYLEEERREALRKALVGRHRITKAVEVEVKEVQVIGQPMGGFIDACVNGDREDLLDGRVLVFDTGFFSVDWVVIADQEVKKQFAGSSTYATSMIFEEATRAVAEDFGGKVSIDRIESAVRGGKAALKVFNREVELTPYIEGAARKLAPVMLNELRKTLRSQGDGIDAVLMVGGGSRFYDFAILEAFPKAEVVWPEAPEIANARGYWQYTQIPG